MTHQAQPIGQEISCVMKDVKRDFLKDNKKLKEIIVDSLKKFDFGLLKIEEYFFEPQGYTLLILLSESHLAIHTYPEYNSLYFNMYSCRGPKDSEPTFNFLKNKLNPKQIIFMKNNEVPIK